MEEGALGAGCGLLLAPGGYMWAFTSLVRRPPTAKVTRALVALQTLAKKIDFPQSGS